MDNIKDYLTINNLYCSYYDVATDTQELEFEFDDAKVLVRNIHIPKNFTEDYWDIESNVNEAIKQADKRDIEITDYQGWVYSLDTIL